MSNSFLGLLICSVCLLMGGACTYEKADEELPELIGEDVSGSYQATQIQCWDITETLIVSGSVSDATWVLRFYRNNLQEIKTTTAGCEGTFYAKSVVQGGTLSTEIGTVLTTSSFCSGTHTITTAAPDEVTPASIDFVWTQGLQLPAASLRFEYDVGLTFVRLAVPLTPTADPDGRCMVTFQRL